MCAPTGRAPPLVFAKFDGTQVAEGSDPYGSVQKKNITKKQENQQKG